MTPLVYLTMFGWIPAVLGLFAFLPPRRAVLVTLIGGWMFLPMATFNLPGLPAYSKTNAVAYSLLLGILLFDSQALTRLRFRGHDLVMAIFCMLPMVSSLANGLGPYDGFSSVLYQTLMWGVPYFVGRLYFSDMDALKELAVAIFIGGVIYIPFCLYEIRFSPQLHRTFYGYHQHAFIQTLRFDGYRPMVFMQHGLMVGLWMTASTITGYWLWRGRVIRRLFGVPMGYWVAGLAVTTVLCKSAGALGMGVIVLGGFWISNRTRVRWPLVAFAVGFPIYLALRAFGIADGTVLVTTSKSIPGVSARVASLESRLMNEAIFVEKTQENFFTGWASQFMVQNESGKDITTPDSMWILVFARIGFFALVTWVILMILPVLAILRYVQPKDFGHPEVVSVTALGAVTTLFALDCILNAMLVPAYLASIGGVVGALSKPFRVVAPATRQVRVVRSSNTKAEPTYRPGGGARPIR